MNMMARDFTKVEKNNILSLDKILGMMIEEVSIMSKAENQLHKKPLMQYRVLKDFTEQQMWQLKRLKMQLHNDKQNQLLEKERSQEKQQQPQDQPKNQSRIPHVFLLSPYVVQPTNYPYSNPSEYTRQQQSFTQQQPQNKEQLPQDPQQQQQQWPKPQHHHQQPQQQQWSNLNHNHPQQQQPKTHPQAQQTYQYQLPSFPVIDTWSPCNAEPSNKSQDHALSNSCQQHQQTHQQTQTQEHHTQYHQTQYLQARQQQTRQEEELDYLHHINGNLHNEVQAYAAKTAGLQDWNEELRSRLQMEIGASEGLVKANEALARENEALAKRNEELAKEKATLKKERDANRSMTNR